MKSKTIFKRDGFKADAPLQVDSITIEHIDDTDADLSYLGEYSSKPADVHIDRQERGEMGRNEHRYFNVGCGDPEYIEQDYKRMKAYGNDWCCIGIRATAQVSYPAGQGSRQLQTFQSSGLWGIESDSDKSHFEQVEADELSSLMTTLEQFGVPIPVIEKEAV